VVADALVLETLPDKVHQLHFQLLLHIPDVLVGNAVDAIEAGLVVVVRGKLGA
jgi:hypothetical protein